MSVHLLLGHHSAFLELVVPHRPLLLVPVFPHPMYLFFLVVWARAQSFYRAGTPWCGLGSVLDPLRVVYDVGASLEGMAVAPFFKLRKGSREKVRRSMFSTVQYHGLKAVMEVPVVFAIGAMSKKQWRRVLPRLLRMVILKASVKGNWVLRLRARPTGASSSMAAMGRTSFAGLRSTGTPCSTLRVPAQFPAGVAIRCPHLTVR